MRVTDFCVNNFTRPLLCLLIGMLAPMTVSSAADTEAALPVPLQLSQAIAIGTRDTHPRLQLARAQLGSADAAIVHAESSYALEAALDFEAARIVPSRSAVDREKNDSQASLSVRKPLYDFGATAARIASAETAASAEQLEYEYVIQQQQFAISRAFADAVLSDYRFSWDNEAMAMLYIRLDRARSRHALTQISDVQLLRAEADYQELLTQRHRSELSQRITRARLAEIMDRPGELATQLQTPDISTEEFALPEPELLISHALQSNLGLRAQQQRVVAAQVALAAARKQTRPSLEAAIRVADYHRDLPNREDWRASLNLKVPLLETGSVQSDVARNQAEWRQREAELLQQRTELRAQIYDTWLQLNQLFRRAGELHTAEQRAERALDKSRGEYDLELRTDYGDTLVNTSRVRYEQAVNRFDILLGMMQLAMQLGNAPQQVLESGAAVFDRYSEAP
jgi:outer membrane protein TolC